MLFALVSYAAAFFLSPLYQAAAAPNPKPGDIVAPRCTVSGRVVTAADGTPLKSARLVLMPEHREERGQSQVYAATSDGDGRFVIKEIPAGRYQFSATRTGYVDQRYQSNGSDNGAILALKPGQEAHDVLFRMVLAAVITGRINDEDGEPLPRIQVMALQRLSEDDRQGSFWMGKQELKPVFGVETDDRGQYRLFGLKPGEYYVRALDEMSPPIINAPEGDSWAARESLGSEYAPVYYPGVTQLGQAQLVPVTAGEEAQVDFAMRRTKTIEISGRVIGPDGKPSSDAYVVLEESGGGGNSAHFAAADSKGEFKLRGVPPGTYTLVAGLESASDSESYHARQKIEVGTDNIESLTLALGRGTSISGHVVVNGRGSLNLDRLLLALISSDGEEQTGGWSRVKKDGTFTILDVPDGSYMLDVSGIETGWYLKSARAGADDILSAGLQVEKGQSGGTLQVIVSNGGAQLEGLVTLDEKPLAGVKVRLTPEPETPYNRELRKIANTDQSGRFALTGLAPGEYRLSAKTVAVDGAKPAASEAKTVSLTEHDHKTMDLVIVPPQSQ